MTAKRILIASNYDDEMFYEDFVNVPSMPEKTAKQICGLLNSIYPKGPKYYKVVEPTYTPTSFEP